MTTYRHREVTFKLYPEDHFPRHAHGEIGSGEVIVDLHEDGTVSLAKRDDAICNVKRSEVGKVLTEAREAFDTLVAHWTRMHHV